MKTVQEGWQCHHELYDKDQVHYCEYISLEGLLRLLAPNATSAKKREFEHDDEVQFLLIHQMFEIAFQLHLFELRRLIVYLSAREYKVAIHILKRIIKLTSTYPVIISMMNTMDPEDFSQFRLKLAPASGAESEASREIELLSGVTKDTVYLSIRGTQYTFKQVLDRTPAEGEGRPKVRLWTENLERVSLELNLATAFESQLTSSKNSEKYPGSDLGQIAELLYEYDLAYRNYRLAHFGVAAHQIGMKPGTGHTDGASYLKSIAETVRFFPKIFPERW